MINSLLRNLRLFIVLLTGCLASVVSAREFVTLIRPVNLDFDAPAANEVKFFPTEGLITGKGDYDKVNFLSTDAINLAVSGKANTDVIEFYDDLFIIERNTELYISAREGYTLREVKICARVFESEAPGLYVGGVVAIPQKDGIYWNYTIDAIHLGSIYIPTQMHIYYILATMDTDNSSGDDSDYPVSWSTDSHSSVSVTLGDNALTEGQSVPVGSRVNIKAIPDDGYRIESLLINNEPQPVNAGPVSIDYTVTSAVSIKVTSAPVESHDGYEVSWTVDGGGSVRVLRSDGTDITNGMNVPDGTALTVIATPLQDYTLAELTINSTSQTLPGQGLPAVVPITVEKDVVIVAKFSEIGSEPPVTSYPVTITYNYGGTVRVLKPDGTVLNSGESVNAGTTLSVLASPDEGYKIISMSICGHNYDVPDDGRMMAQPYVVSGNTDIMVEFGLIDGEEGYEVSWTVDGGGSVRVLRSDGTDITNGMNVPEGTALTVIATPSQDYTLAELTINSTSHTLPGQGLPAVVPITVEKDVVIVAKFSEIGSEPPVTAYPVTVAYNYGGTVRVLKPNGAVLNSGELVNSGTTLSVLASPDEGYKIVSMSICGHNYDVPDDDRMMAQPYVVSGNTDIMVEFGLKDGVEKCIVSWAEHPYGTVVVLDGSRTISNGAEIAGGTELTILISSLEGYNVVGATLNGQIVPNLTPGRIVTLTHKLSGNLSIESFYSGPENHCLTVATVTGGSIIVTGPDDKPYGGIANIRDNTNVVITAKAETGFSLTELRINGELYYSDKPTSEYSTSYTIDSDTHITAVFTDNSGVEVVTDTDIVLEIFDLNGHRIPLNNIKPGLYIIRDAKGIRKVRL